MWLPLPWSFLLTVEFQVRLLYSAFANYFLSTCTRAELLTFSHWSILSGSVPQSYGNSDFLAKEHPFKLGVRAPDTWDHLLITWRFWFIYRRPPHLTKHIVSIDSVSSQQHLLCCFFHIQPLFLLTLDFDLKKIQAAVLRYSFVFTWMCRRMCFVFFKTKLKL
jgi:hypothetical protein